MNKLKDKLKLLDKDTVINKINEKKLQYSLGKIKKISGITIHNTGNSLSALENANLMNNLEYPVSVHYFVDEDEIIKVLDEDEQSIHTGKAYDKGNTQTISIEICRSKSSEELYFKAQKRAVILIKLLLKKYKLNNNNIYFHNDFDNRVYCPHKILKDYGSKNNFIEREF